MCIEILNYATVNFLENQNLDLVHKHCLKRPPFKIYQVFCRETYLYHSLQKTTE